MGSEREGLGALVWAVCQGEAGLFHLPMSSPVCQLHSVRHPRWSWLWAPGALVASWRDPFLLGLEDHVSFMQEGKSFPSSPYLLCPSVLRPVSAGRFKQTEKPSWPGSSVRSLTLTEFSLWFCAQHLTCFITFKLHNIPPWGSCS